MSIFGNKPFAPFLPVAVSFALILNVHRTAHLEKGGLSDRLGSTVCDHRLDPTSLGSRGAALQDPDGILSGNARPYSPILGTREATERPEVAASSYKVVY
jgi:hypothetical protein